MSIISRSDASLKPNTSSGICSIKVPNKTQKILEEDEYLDRMSKIIRRDFFPNSELVEEAYSMNGDMSGLYNNTPGTDGTRLSTTSSIKSRREACSMGLNDFLDKYTSEDNAYFDKLQRKELKRHRAKYPWLYPDKNNHNKKISQQLQLMTSQDTLALTGTDSSTKMIDWPHNPKNSLFYPPSDVESRNKRQTIINYNSSKYANEPIFKRPLPIASSSKCVARIPDKIGIDGNLLADSDVPIINGYSFIAPPESPRAVIEEPKIKSEFNKFYIPNESPRDELAHRVYKEKFAKSIRTPRTGGSTATPIKTPKSFRKGYSDFSFSPERVKGATPRKK